MTKYVLTHDDVSGDCEKSLLRPYPIVTSDDGSVTITPTTNALTGQVTYDLEGSGGTVVEGPVGTFTFTPSVGAPVVWTVAADTDTTIQNTAIALDYNYGSGTFTNSVTDQAGTVTDALLFQDSEFAESADILPYVTQALWAGVDMMSTGTFSGGAHFTRTGNRVHVNAWVVFRFGPPFVTIPTEGTLDIRVDVAALGASLGLYSSFVPETGTKLTPAVFDAGGPVFDTTVSGARGRLFSSGEAQILTGEYDFVGFFGSVTEEADFARAVFTVDYKVVV